MPRLPNFLIIGAPRSGSTSLFRYLSPHPSIYMAKPKEVRYFSSQFDKGIDWYTDHFATASSDQLAGEATPGYLHRPESVDRIAEVVPDARLIVVLRDPVERAYSHYWMDTIRGATDLSFEEHAMSTAQLRIGNYIDSLRYVTGRFPREHLLVLFTADLTNRSRDIYGQTCRFLGIDDSFVPQSLGKTVNQYVEFRSFTVRSWTKRMPQWAELPKRIVSRLNTRAAATYPQMDSEVREMLAREYAPANERLAEWLGADLPGWTEPSRGQQ